MFDIIKLFQYSWRFFAHNPE